MIRWLLRHLHRSTTSTEALPESARAVIRKNLPLWALLPEPLQNEGLQKVQVFLGEKKFEGCGGLELTEEIRVTIAAQACLLLLGREVAVYPRLHTILVYPSSYMESGPDAESSSARLGESWDRGVVVLAWHSVLGGGLNPHDGRNVVLHEFAHQLDQAHGPADGLPNLDREGEGIRQRHGRYTAWARVLGEEYQELLQKLDRGKRTWLDPYAGTNPAEFFAVATETFFEKPRAMQRRHPELYEELSSFYQVDPVTWDKR